MSTTALRKKIAAGLKRKPDIHKGECGRILIVAGSPGMTGAAALAAGGALRCGGGLVTVATPRSVNPILEVKLTEAMTLPLPETSAGTLSQSASETVLEQAKRADILLVGPGLSQNPQTKKCIRQILLNTSIPVVLDADGLNAIADFTEILAKIKPSVIITPHIGEFSRLFKQDSAYVKQNAENCAKKISVKFGITVALKSHRTVVACAHKTFINTSGNPGLATGGSGDVLSGMIAACYGSFKNVFDAVKVAVYLHGLSADIAVKDKTQVAFLPSDVIDYIPHALQRCGVK